MSSAADMAYSDAVALLAMTKRLSASFTQSLSGTLSIRACSETRSFATVRLALSSVMSSWVAT